MDSVWFVRSGPNEELRFSLRSAYHHAGVENVWIVGDPPDWYTGPRIDGNRFMTKPMNVYDNVRIIAEHPDLPDRVAVWNDDFYAMRRGTRVRMATRATLEEQVDGVKDGWWRESLRATLGYLRDLGIDNPTSYELHRPFPITREYMAKVLADAAHVQPHNPPQWRTLYGNLAPHEGGVREYDAKVSRVTNGKPIPTGPWLSTVDRSWRGIHRILTRTFPQRSPWESPRRR